MKRFFTLSLLAVLLCTLSIAQVSPVNKSLKRVNARQNAELVKQKKVGNKKSTLRPNFAPKFTQTNEESGLHTKVLLTEDFSKFTEGTESAPSTTRVDDADGFIDDKYVSTPGWGGFEVYQAGGVAYLGFSKSEGATGMLISPNMNLSGCVTIKLRAKSTSEEGDYFNYNIVDPGTSEVIDANYFYISNEWTDVEFITSAGMESACLFLFTEACEVYVDDIEISSKTLDTPVLGELTNLSDKGFTLNWETVGGANCYDVYAFADHPVGEDGRCILADINFNTATGTGGTENNPVLEEVESSILVDKYCDCDYSGWTVQYPAYADGMIGISGAYSAWEEYGFISSPELNMLGKDGVVNVAFRTKATKDEKITISLVSLTQQGFQIVSQKEITATGDWQNVNENLTDAGQFSYVQIVYNGVNIMLIDDIKLSIALDPGTTYRHQFLMKTVEGSSYDVKVPSIYTQDQIYYTMRAVRLQWAEEEGYMYLAWFVESPFTELQRILLPTAIHGVTADDAHMTRAAYDMQGRKVNVGTLKKGSLYIQGGKVRMK